MTWHAQLSLDYQHEASRSVLRHTHSGPLRILQSLYPEGEAVCHNVLVHPPGGLVGGDTLDIQARVASHAHALITTPGAARFYRSDGAPALQRTQLQLESHARMEWLPLETLCYSGCIGENRLHLQLAPGAELIGWDITSLGLPLAAQPFVQGSYTQHLELANHWLERGTVTASDTRLLHSPVGLAGNACFASLFFATGTPLNRARRDALLDSTRALLQEHHLRPTAGATAVNPHVVVVRVLAPVVEPALGLLRQVWQMWRTQLWELPPCLPRIWAM